MSGEAQIEGAKPNAMRAVARRYFMKLVVAYGLVVRRDELTREYLALQQYFNAPKGLLKRG